jgi:hypothetical protein
VQDAIPAHGRASDSCVAETSRNEDTASAIEDVHDDPDTTIVVLCSRAEIGRDGGTYVGDHVPAAYSQDIADGAAQDTANTVDCTQTMVAPTVCVRDAATAIA